MTEYPKMVPGPDGTVVVQNEREEMDVLSKRVAGLSQRPTLTINRIKELEVLKRFARPSHRPR